MIPTTLTSTGLTPFGVAFLCLCAATSYFRPQWLVALFPTAAVMQSPAVAIVSVGGRNLGISAIHAWSFFAVVCWIFLTRGEAVASMQTALRCRFLRPWIVFWIFASISAVALPTIFADMNVHVLLDKAGDMIPPRPLSLNIYHFVQIVNTASIAILFLLIQLRSIQGGARAGVVTLFCGVVCAAVLSALFTLQHKMVVWGIVVHWNSLWTDNPSYNQSYGAITATKNLMERTSLPFIEPSYASAWYAAIVVGCWFAWVMAFGAGIEKPRATGVIRLGFLLGGLLASLALLSSLGNTGLLALPISIGLLVVALIVWATIVHASRNGVGALRLCQRIPIIRAITSVFACLVLAVLLLVAAPARVQQGATATWADMRGRVAQATVTNSAAVDTGRSASNALALDVLFRTYGLGVGMGSNRASGYFHALLSNVGIVGTLMFLIAFWRQSVAVVSNLSSLRGENAAHDQVVFAISACTVGAVVCMTVAVAGGIPDQNWPIFWVFVGLVFSLSFVAKQNSKKLNQTAISPVDSDSRPPIFFPAK